jgi:hypothetical protein
VTRQEVRMSAGDVVRAVFAIGCVLLMTAVAIFVPVAAITAAIVLVVNALN